MDKQQRKWLKGISFKEALCHAKEVADMTNEVISAESERYGEKISKSRVGRYFSKNDEYNPSPEIIPQLCRIFQNDILIDWLFLQLEEHLATSAIGTPQQMCLAIMNIHAITGELSEDGSQAVADNVLTLDEIKGQLPIAYELLKSVQKYIAGLEKAIPQKGETL